MNSKLDFDVVVCGGGLVGASLAYALEGSGLKAAVIEPAASGAAGQPSFDTRRLALTYSAKVLLDRWGLWETLSPGDAAAIAEIIVCERGSGAYTRLGADDVSCEALGWNVSARAIGRCLYARLDAMPHVQVIAGTNAAAVRAERDRVRVDIESGGTPGHLNASVAVIADGGRSPLAQQAGFEPDAARYPQNALICRLELDQAHQGTAYEIFAAAGPIALLPAGDREYSLVWTHESDASAFLLNCDEPTFIARLQQEIGERAKSNFVRITGDRVVYPLVASRLKTAVKERIAVVGNAAHTVHPVAGQGLNLSLRDIAEFANVLARHHRRGWDIGSLSVLSRYDRRRSAEAAAVSMFTDGLVRLFASDRPLVQTVRRAGICAAGSSSPLRRFVLNRTVGLRSLQQRAGPPGHPEVSHELRRV